MRFCQRCKRWHPVEGEHLCQTPEDGHTFRISAVSRGSYGVVGQEGHTDADWFAEQPFVLEVRAWSLRAALRLAAEQPLSAWDHGEPPGPPNPPRAPKDRPVA